MENEWLRRLLSPLEAPLEFDGQKIYGALVVKKRRKEWRFSADLSATVSDLCEELRRQGGYAAVECPSAGPQTRVLDICEPSYLLVEKKHSLLIEPETVVAAPRMEKTGEKKPLKRSLKKIELEKVQVRKRLCEICKRKIAQHKKIQDALMPPKIKRLCAECYFEFHRRPDGSRKYEDFSYTQSS